MVFLRKVKRLKTLMTFIGTICIFLISTGDIMSEGKRGDASVRMRIYLVAGKDGAKLKPGKEGLVFVRVYNQTERSVAVPLSYMYGKGRQDMYNQNQTARNVTVRVPYKYGKGRGVGLKPSYVAEDDTTFYAGFEIATIKHCFSDSKGNNIMENVVACSSDSLDLGPKQEKTLSIPIRTPSKAGVYKLKLLFDNRNLEKAIDSNNTRGPIKQSLFQTEMLLEGIVVKE